MARGRRYERTYAQFGYRRRRAEHDLNASDLLLFAKFDRLQCAFEWPRFTFFLHPISCGLVVQTTSSVLQQDFHNFCVVRAKNTMRIQSGLIWNAPTMKLRREKVKKISATLCKSFISSRRRDAGNL